MAIKIGITGSRGFIARHIIESLKTSKRKIRLSYFDLPNGNILNPAALKRFVKKKDIIVHAAAVNRGNDTEVIAGSVVGTYHLVSAIADAKQKPKIIFLSSSKASLNNIYGSSKRLAEKMLEDFSKRNSVPVTIIRLPNIFGEGAKTFYNSVVATFCFQAARGDALTVHGASKNKKIKLVYVKDAAKVIAGDILKERRNKFVFKTMRPSQKITVGNLAKLIQSFRLLKNTKSLKSKFYKDLYKTYLSYAPGAQRTRP